MTAYSASVEWFTPEAGILRVHESDTGSVGDPYVWCCTIHRWCPSLCTIKGAMTPPPRRSGRSINDALYAEGLRGRTHERAEGEDGWRVVYRPLRAPRKGGKHV